MTAEFTAAVHCIVYLNHKKDYVQSEEIADNVCTNPARIRKIMAKLKKAGLVKAHTSFNGGYKFCADPERTTLYDIFKATEDTLLNVKWHSGNEDADCPVSKGMAPVMNNVFWEIERGGKDILSGITISDIDGKIFPKNI